MANNKNQVVFGLVNSPEQANRIVNRLLTSGFTNADISVLSPEASRERTAVDARGEPMYAGTAMEKNPKRSGSSSGLTVEKNSKAPEGAATGAATGGLLGGALGLLAGIGTIAIPGLGAFIAAGPIMAALSGTAVGGGLGMLVGGLVGLGIPEMEAKRYQDALKRDAKKMLMSVHATSNEEIKKARTIMEKEGASDVTDTCEK